MTDHNTQPLTEEQPMRPAGGCSLAGPDGSRIPTEEPHAYSSRKGANTIWVRTCDLCGDIDWDDLHEQTLQRVADETHRLRDENTALRVKIEEGLEAAETARATLAMGEADDGYHTHNELYDYRMLYNAHAVMGWLADGFHVVKSWYHSDGELCFGGGWFVVVAELSTGQVTNHYKAEHWGLFTIPEELPPAYDGHSPAEAANRLRAALEGDQNGDAA
jgi:regulator of replication initiation timing